MPPKVIVFDFWMTLISGSDKELMDKLARELHFKDSKEFWDYCDDHLFSCNKSMRDFFIEIMKERNIDMGKLTDIEKIFGQSRRSVKRYPDVIPILERLKGKYKLAILSNTQKEEGMIGLEILGASEYFDEIIFSCDVGLAKPNIAFFELILKRFQVEPEEVLFIGDHVDNDIKPAKKLGFKTILLDREGRYPNNKDADIIVRSLDEINL